MTTLERERREMRIRVFNLKASRTRPRTSRTNSQPAYCCTKRAQKCTQRIGQYNICWSTTDNPYHEVTEDEAQKTLNDSKAAADPDATTTSVDIARLVSPDAGLPSSSPPPLATPANAEASPTGTTRSSAQEGSQSGGGDDNDDDSLSGGAIAGIVIGCLAGVVLVAAAVFFLWRRSRRGKGAANTNSGDYSAVQRSGEGQYASEAPAPGYGYGGYDEKSTAAPSSYTGAGRRSAPSYMSPTSPPADVHPQGQRYEVEGTVVAHEVPGDQRR